jgi:hypothetical protein
MLLLAAPTTPDNTEYDSTSSAPANTSTPIQAAQENELPNGPGRQGAKRATRGRNARTAAVRERGHARERRRQRHAEPGRRWAAVPNRSGRWVRAR